MRRGALPIAPPCLADAVQSLIMPGGSEWRGDSRRIFAELNRRDPERWRDGQRPTMTNLKATPVMVGDRLFLNVNMPTSVAAAVDAVAQRVEDSGRRHRGLLPSGNRHTHRAGPPTLRPCADGRGQATPRQSAWLAARRPGFCHSGPGLVKTLDRRTHLACSTWASRGVRATPARRARRPRGKRLARRLVRAVPVAQAQETCS